MNKLQWKTVYPQFSPREKWGDSEKMDFRLIWILYRARCLLGRRIYINRAVDPKGSESHKNGLAVDFRVEGVKLINIVPFKLPDKHGLGCSDWFTLSMNNNPAIFDIVRYFSLCRLGFYPYWTYNGKLWAGFHVDIKPEYLNWWRDAKGKYHYNLRLSKM